MNLRNKLFIHPIDTQVVPGAQAAAKTRSTKSLVKVVVERIKKLIEEKWGSQWLTPKMEGVEDQLEMVPQDNRMLRKEFNTAYKVCSERIQHFVQGLLWTMDSINVGGKRCGNKTHDVKDIGSVVKEVEEQLETVRQDNRILAEVFKTTYEVLFGSKGSTMGIITVGDKGYINETHDVKDIGSVLKEVEEQLETVNQVNRMLVEVFKASSVTKISEYQAKRAELEKALKSKHELAEGLKQFEIANKVNFKHWEMCGMDIAENDKNGAGFNNTMHK